MTEAEIKNQICELLERFPDRCLFTVNSAGRKGYQSRFMRTGWPDIYGIWESKPLFIEVKKPGGAMSCQQFGVMVTADKMGAITILAQSIDDVRKILKI